MIKWSNCRRLHSLINQLVLSWIGILVRLTALALKMRVIHRYRAPGRIRLRLFLEWPIQSILDSCQVEAANSWSCDAVFRCCEGSIDDGFGLEEVDGLDLVEVERIIARNGTVKSGLEKCCPEEERIGFKTLLVSDNWEVILQKEGEMSKAFCDIGH